MPESEGGFKEFRIDKLFEASSGDTDIQISDLSGTGIPIVSSGTKNNGIIGLSDIKAKVFEPNTITIDMFGNCYFQKEEYKMVTHARVFSLSPLEFHLNEKRGLYFVSHFSYANKLFSYGNMASWQKIKEHKLSLPILRNGKINWWFIESSIEDIIKSRKEQLHRFLTANGYSDCSLNVEQQQALTDVATGNVRMQLIKIVDAFNVANTHNILKSDVVFGSGTAPYVTASESDNSVTSYISYIDDLKESGNTIMIGGKTLVITYQPRDFFSNDSHNLTLTIKDERGRNESAQLFMVAALYKSLKPIYSWGNSISKAKIQKDFVELPVTNDGSIDFAFMETYINALKKQCIARLKASDVFPRNTTAITEQIEETASNIQILDTSDVPASERFTRYLPIYSIKAACGNHEFNFSEAGLDNDLGWIEASELGHRLNKNMFVVQAVGHSMEPKINDGDYCVFEWYTPDNAGSREGKIILAKDITDYDDDYSGRFTIKRYHRVSGNKVELQSINPGHPTFILEGNNEYEQSNPVLAVFIGIL